MPKRREVVFICTVCEPMFAQTLIDESALTNFARDHIRKHSLRYGQKNSRVITIVSSPELETDTPELEGLLRWESYARTTRSEEHVSEEGEEGAPG